VARHQKNSGGFLLRVESASNLLCLDRDWSLRMSVVENTHFWLLVLAASCLVMLFLPGRYSPEMRERRKRQKNYGRVISKARGPVVTLSVRTTKP
jgi:uncharacterized membrane protein YdfJ with MMPL/SSD domain